MDSDDVNQLKTKNDINPKFLKAIGLDDPKDLIICHTCLKSIKKKKFPSMNEFNGLQLEDVPEELKLEDLEQQLIAKTLLFIKVKKLPGSSRMKAGTAQKLILNMITTATMIQLGHVKGNKMIDMKMSNKKLVGRAESIVMKELKISQEKAKQLLKLHGNVRKVINAAKNHE